MDRERGIHRVCNTNIYVCPGLLSVPEGCAVFPKQPPALAFSKDAAHPLSPAYLVYKSKGRVGMVQEIPSEFYAN